MNTYTLNLSTNSTSSYQVLNELKFEDHTKLILNFTNIDKTYLPFFLKIDWGFNNPIIIENDIYNDITNQILESNFNNVLFKDEISYEYYPSSTSLYKKLSAQVLVKYSNSEYSYFIVPISIRTYGYTESIGDMELLNTNILPTSDNNAEHQIKTSSSGYIIELRGD